MRRWRLVRILLDEQLPRQLARHITGHRVRTVQQCGWAGLKNGELLRRAAADGFEIFLTGDQNLAYQQNLSGLPLCVIVLVGRTNKLDDLLPLVPALLSVMTNVRPGEVRRVGVP
jgi:predicted nuclease of predicted toxin-antitoxin system